MNAAPCAGQGDLFDSTDEHAHAEARAICMAPCPLINGCRKQRDATIAEYGSGEHGVRGTWAGGLYGRRGVGNRNVERIATEEDAYSDEEARRAHAAYSAGDGSPWAVTGHRVYDRRARRAQRARKRAA